MKNLQDANKSDPKFIESVIRYWNTHLYILVEKILLRIGINPLVAREGVGVFSLRIINTILSFLSTVLLSRLLGANGYGIYAYAYAWVIILSLPAEAGLPNLIVRETARGITQDRPDIIQGVWRWSGKLVGVISLGLALLVGLLLFLWHGWLSRLQVSTFIWALVLVPLIALSDLRGAALRGLKKITVGQLPEFIVRPATFTFLLILVFLLGRSILPDLAMALNVFAAALAFLIGIWLLWRYTPMAVRQAKPITVGRSWFASSIFFTLIAGFGVINSQASTVILGFFKQPEQVGIYRVAVQVATLASLGLQTVNMLIAPHFAELFAQKNMVRLQQLTVVSARVVLVFNLVLTILFILLGRAFFGIIFGSDFSASYSPLVILLFGQLLNSITGSVGYLLNMTGHERDTTRGLGIAAGINIVLNFIFIPLWSVQGAALASTISMIVWNAILWWKVHQRLGISSLAFSIGNK